MKYIPYLFAFAVFVIAMIVMVSEAEKQRQAYYKCLEAQVQISNSKHFSDRVVVNIPNCK